MPVRFFLEAPTNRCVSASIVVRCSTPRMTARSSVRDGAGISITSINRGGRKSSELAFSTHLW